VNDCPQRKTAEENESLKYSGDTPQRPSSMYTNRRWRAGVGNALEMVRQQNSVGNFEILPIGSVDDEILWGRDRRALRRCGGGQ